VLLILKHAVKLEEESVGDGRAVGSEPQTARRPMRRRKALGRGNTRAEKKWRK